MEKGEIIRVSGPLVVAKDVNCSMYEVVLVGEEQLVGEVIEIKGNKTFIQVYEDTTGLRPKEPVYRTYNPLSVALGPGLLKSIFDGIQRPLEIIAEKQGIYIKRGANV